MMQLDAGAARSAVFLDEMGIGPLWRPRQGPAPLPLATGQAAPVVEMVAEVVISEVPPQPVVEEAPVPAVAVAPPFEAMPEAVALPIHAEPEPEPESRLQPRSGAPSGDDSNAWFDDAPPPPAAAPVTDEQIAAMDWDELKAAVAKCARCEACHGRQGVIGRGDRDATLMVVGGAPSRADEKSASVISGDGGALLDNMLLALGKPAAPDGGRQGAYITNLIKCRLVDANGSDRAPTADEVTACKPFLRREFALTGAGTVLAFGQPTLRALLGDTAPAARGTVHRLGRLSVVASFHPDSLLGQPANKAKAWADLCLVKSVDGQSG